MDDRLSHLEQRVQLQDDEIQLLKAALADALRRLGCCEEITQANSKKGGPTKGTKYCISSSLLGQFQVKIIKDS